MASSFGKEVIMRGFDAPYSAEQIRYVERERARRAHLIVGRYWRERGTKSRMRVLGVKGLSVSYLNCSTKKHHELSMHMFLRNFTPENRSWEKIEVST